jgi:excisionase family DNA binding protein
MVFCYNVYESGEIMIDEKKLLSVKDIASMLQLKETTVREWIKKGKIKGLKFGHQWRFRTSDIEEWLNRGDHKDEVKEENSDFSTARSLKKFFGTWDGPKEEFEIIMKAIREARSDAEF